MNIPKQCRSCGGGCGGGYTLKSGRYKPCQNIAHLDRGPGRPTQDNAEDIGRYNVSLDPETVRKAKSKSLGRGNLSLGLRKAVKAAHEE